MNKVRVTLDVMLPARAPPAPKRQGTHFEQQQLPAQQGGTHLCEPVAMRWKTPSPHKERSGPLGYFKMPQSSAGQTRDILEHAGAREMQGPLVGAHAEDRTPQETQPSTLFSMAVVLGPLILKSCSVVLVSAKI